MPAAASRARTQNRQFSTDKPSCTERAPARRRLAHVGSSSAVQLRQCLTEQTLCVRDKAFVNCARLTTNHSVASASLMRAMADQGSSQAVRNSVCGCELRRMRRRVVGLSMGICMPMLIEECARVCARASNCFRSVRCFVRRRAARSAQRVCRRADDLRHADPPARSSVWRTTSAEDFRRRRRHTDVLDPEQAEWAGVQHHDRPALGHADAARRSAPYSNIIISVSDGTRPHRCPHSRSR